jgi:hypothetical protein
MPTAWNSDDPADLGLISANCAALFRTLAGQAQHRTFPDRAELCRWHTAIFAGCAVPVAGYLGHVRGDPSDPELAVYEVGVGRMQIDGHLEKQGFPARLVADELDRVLTEIHDAMAEVDAMLAPGQRPRTVLELHHFVALTAMAHGELVRVHPFANGNGRTARTFVAFLCLRYRVPPFLDPLPRPNDVMYADASRDSMGRRPDYAGDHTRAVAVFGHLLTLALMP